MNSFQKKNNNLGGVQFGIDGEGNRCYLGADGSLVPFKSNEVQSGTQTVKVPQDGYSDKTHTFAITFEKPFDKIPDVVAQVNVALYQTYSINSITTTGFNVAILMKEDYAATNTTIKWCAWT